MAWTAVDWRFSGEAIVDSDSNEPQMEALSEDEDEDAPPVEKKPEIPYPAYVVTSDKNTKDLEEVIAQHGIVFKHEHLNKAQQEQEIKYFRDDGNQLLVYRDDNDKIHGYLLYNYNEAKQ